ncbi:hypothetical protein DM02DRAFT_642118 [Periconia macrospinosa]|uniref:RTA1 like protein n=1 Tax=Periconia macrospinosa TaxID=97972 RepID=A0A2V1DW10_9PLEO|nr:hypothetical protein DM02DRAFT_642118 [Periconia macrospinosa]
MADNAADFKLYRYDPSMAAAVIFIIGFLVITSIHFYQMIRTRTWILIPFLTKIFVIGDVISFLVQGGGGGIMATGTISALHIGEKIIIGGLVVQLLFFERQLYALYGASALILIRSVFRLIEYAQGNVGYLISHEVFLYFFDSTLMLATMILIAWIHPSEITARLMVGCRQRVRRNADV